MTEHTYYPICDQCVRAEGDECHTPGCALFLHDAPDHPIHEEHGIDLARVRRDAAGEVLDGLVDWSRAEYDRARHEGRTGGMTLELHVQQAVSSYSRAHYPEETP